MSKQFCVMTSGKPGTRGRVGESGGRRIGRVFQVVEYVSGHRGREKLLVCDRAHL